MGQLEEIERINQIRADLKRQRDHHTCLTGRMSNAILATIGGDGEYLLTVHQHGDLGMGQHFLSFAA